MLDIKQIVEVTLFFEDSGAKDGAYHNDPKDPGKETKYGISKKWHPHVDIASLTEDAAVHIYMTEYYATTGIVRLTELVTATKVFDMAVNLGPIPAIRMLEQAVNKLFGFNKVGVNGILSVTDAQIINAFTPDQTAQLITLLKIAGKVRHMGQIIINMELAENEQGWLRRDYWPYNAVGRAWPYFPVGNEGWPNSKAVVKA